MHNVTFDKLRIHVVDTIIGLMMNKIFKKIWNKARGMS
ncbi:MAG: ESPR domain-containing protein [Burkholderiales bacterium]|nr:ESPR domain-containing protein [Burkholderiales bacterium]